VLTTPRTIGTAEKSICAPAFLQASDWNNRAHFTGLAANSPEKLDEVVELDVALKKLEMEKPRQARVVELRYLAACR
jgi:hypothetical protein